MMKQKTIKKVRNARENLGIILVCASVMVGGGLIARAVKPEAKSPDNAQVATVPSSDHEAIKAEILDKDPAHFTIDVEKMANMNANDNADTFAVYTASSVPDECGDFRELELPYEKPEEYKRTFDLSDHPEVLDALDSYGCVVMKNIPPNAS